MISLRAEGVGSPDFDKRCFVAGIFDSDNFGRSILSTGSRPIGSIYRRVNIKTPRQGRILQILKSRLHPTRQFTWIMFLYQQIFYFHGLIRKSAPNTKAQYH